MTNPTVEPPLGFEGFVAARGQGLWRAAWLLTGDRQHAEDLVQAALVKTYGRYEALGNDHKFEAYVRTTIYRTYVSWWRRLSWRTERSNAHLDGVDPAAATSVDHLRLDVQRALDTLPRMQRAVLAMRFFDDLSVAEVAERLGISEGTVKKYTSRGCASLRTSIHLIDERARA